MPGRGRGGPAVVLAGLLAAGALGAGGWWLGRGPGPAGVRTTLTLAEALGDGGAAGFARAAGPRAFAFPADHGPHAGYRTEWWYYTGNLATAEGRRFGFQLTVFRTALAPAPAARSSAWAASHVLTGHFALTDVAGRRFYAADRVSREALGLAGARLAPFRVWVEDWTVDGEGPTALPMRLRAAEAGLGIDLVLAGGKPPVLQGDRGWSRKSAEPGSASYYYSLTRMPTRGTVRIDGRAFEVEGLAWMDREWSTSALGADQVGWDWFALQLVDGRELMLYRLRRRDGSLDPVSEGTLVRADGSTRRLLADAAQVETLDHWASPRGGASYPARWRVRVPGEDVDVLVTPYVADQELDLGVRYWEGAARVTTPGGAAAGSGYVELVGYARPAVARGPTAVRK